MKKYNISYTETVFYLNTEVKAKSVEEAREKFYEMLNDGNVEVNDTEQESIQIEEIK